MLGGGDLVGLQREIGNKRPVILEEKGHYILATGEAQNTVTIRPVLSGRAKLDTPRHRNTFSAGGCIVSSGRQRDHGRRAGGVTFVVKETATGDRPSRRSQPQPQTPVTK